LTTDSHIQKNIAITETSSPLDVSVIVPLYNEEESLPHLFRWLKDVLEQGNYSYEVIAVNDGSTDGSWEVVKAEAKLNENIKGISLLFNVGKSAALDAGFRASKGRVVITMDADLQDSPDEIPALMDMINIDGYDMVSGWKKERHDPIGKTLPSKLFNATTRMVTGIKLHDFNCGLKAYRQDVVKSLSLMGEMHRYIPLLAKSNGFKKIGEKVVEHRAREFGTTKFGMERFTRGFFDLLTASFLGRFGRRPMHFFGSLGVLSFMLGFISAAVIGFKKWQALQDGVKAPLVANSPFFYIALTLMLMGVMLFLAGFLGELITRQKSAQTHYQIKEMV